MIMVFSSLVEGYYTDMIFKNFLKLEFISLLFFSMLRACYLFRVRGCGVLISNIPKYIYTAYIIDKIVFLFL